MGRSSQAKRRKQVAIILREESIKMQEEKRCPRCKHGRHKEHSAEFQDRKGVTKVCECPVCVPKKET